MKTPFFISASIIVFVFPLVVSADTTVATPTDLTVSRQAPHALQVSWSSDCSDCKYRLRYGTEEDLSDVSTVTGLTTTSKTLYDLAANTTYYLSVAAYTAEATSEYSDTITASTTPQKVDQVKIKRSNTRTTQVIIRWAEQTQVDNYHIRIFHPNGRLARRLTTTKANAIVSLQPNTAYLVQVAASHNDLRGPFSLLVIFRTRQQETDDSIWNTPANCLVANNETDNSRCWQQGEATFYGNVTVKDEMYTLKETDAVPTHYYQDIDVSDITGRYILMIARTSAEEVLEDDITGLPYLYGYQMDTADHIVDYLNNSDTTLFNGVASEWEVNYEIAPVVDSVEQIRFFLQQASRKDTPQTGRAAKFKFIGVFIVDSEADAEGIIAEYENTL